MPLPEGGPYFFDKSPLGAGWPRLCVAEDGLELLILVPVFHKHYDSRCACATTHSGKTSLNPILSPNRFRFSWLARPSYAWYKPVRVIKKTVGNNLNCWLGTSERAGTFLQVYS